jgi:hypothetical protein
MMEEAVAIPVTVVVTDFVTITLLAFPGEELTSPEMIDKSKRTENSLYRCMNQCALRRS